MTRIEETGGAALRRLFAFEPRPRRRHQITPLLQRFGNGRELVGRRDSIESRGRLRVLVECREVIPSCSVVAFDLVLESLHVISERDEIFPRRFLDGPEVARILPASLDGAIDE